MDERLYDAIVIGGGPAGLTAALYLARARYRVLVLEKERFGGQITITADVVNFPGVERGSGREITAVMKRQAESFGAEFLLAEASQLLPEGAVKTVKTPRGDYEAFGIVIATGASPRAIGFPGEAEFKGRGVAYCATCDGEFFTGMDVFVIGGGFAAAEEAVFLTRYARRVTIVMRGKDFSCAKTAADAAKRHEKIGIHYSTAIVEVSGDTALRKAKFRNTQTGGEWEYTPPPGETFGVFVFAGYEPLTKLVAGKVALDEHGYIITNNNRETNIKGVYAAGDVCVKNLRQMVTATADGAIAAAELERRAAEMQAETGRVPRQPVTRAAAKEESAGTEGFFSPEVRQQLGDLFAKMENNLILRIYPDEKPVSGELGRFMSELAAESGGKLTLEFAGDHGEAERPCVRICRAGGADTGLAFHGVPGGHEFNSFVIALYNAAGPGQALDGELMRRIRAITRPVAMRILVSLSCTMCPELVMAAWKIAAENPLVTADVYDINHFPALREQYKAMSVPCLAAGGVVSFGRKGIPELLDLLETAGSA
ncbi:MAG: FAD-dependent oxidoreductase [Treponema sp.]|jgi:thioredoxin reductase (NADPH)|nr:FAD-dependent oxidoreductase [Treponema sp.]